ncbi:MAG: PHP domain-containing protein [Sandaracinaceae bacterium]|nr:PHP domain-containing protein [Sandaracinaceae bacterium]
MSTRRAVVDALDRIAFSAELLDDPRARTWTAAAWAVRNSSGDLRELLDSGELAKVRGIGKSTLKAVTQALDGQKPDALVDLEARVPEGLFGIRKVKGLGPKKVKRLWQELAVTSLGELEYACRENRLVDLSGFGTKTQDSVLAEIDRLRSTAGALRRDQARAILEPIEHALWVADAVAQVAVVGDWARGEELVRELAVLVETSDPDAAREQLERARPRDVEVALHVADAASFAAVRVWLTSSAGHAAALAARAEARGWRFDPEGLFDADGAAIGCEEEDDVYRALGLVPTALERRQDGVPLVLEGRARPALVRREDLRGALHNHTVASDGNATLEEMREAAAARGLEYLGISEHSPSAFYARGLEKERLFEQLTTIDALNVEPGGCTLLTGIESDIREQGELDYPDEVLAELDVVVASVHKRHPQDAAAMTRRMVAAASHPFTDVVGHPTGRLLLGRAPSEYDVEAFLDACRDHGVAVELNANPHRLDLNEHHLKLAKERGVLVSIAADAHAVRELDHLDYGVTIARRAGLTAEDVLNARTLEELRRWIAERRA